MNTNRLRVLLCGVLTLSVAVAGAGAGVAADEGLKASLTSQLVDGASFSTVADLGVQGSQTYVYTPSERYSPAPMMTPVIMVYSDAGYASRDAAWKNLSRLGLVSLAENEHAVLIVQNPVAGGWSADDAAVYEGILGYIWGANQSGLPISYFRMTYLVGEGAGATFINQYMTQAPYVNRIAGIATFGGSMPDVEPGSALPAYIVGGSAEAIDYYKTVNSVDARDGFTFYNTVNPAKEVTVHRAATQRFNRARLSDAYHRLFRYTVRQALSTPPFSDFSTTEDFTLIKRPNLAELGLTQNLITGAGTGDTGLSLWYEWVPNEASEGASSGSSETYPLVISMHGGGDHEIYEAESNGWVDLAGEERFILVAPRHQDSASLQRMIDVIKDKYPVDASRIYLTGFSGGARKTWQAASRYPDTFAAIAPMNSPDIEGRNTEGFNYDLAGLAALTDLPVYFQIADHDPTPSLLASDSQPYNQLKPGNLIAVNQFKELNEIDPIAAPDFATYPFWGFAMDPYKEYVSQAYGFTVTTATVSDDEGIPMMQFGMAHNLNHTHYVGSARVAWEFMSSFTRDTITKEIFYTARDGG